VNRSVLFQHLDLFRFTVGLLIFAVFLSSTSMQYMRSMGWSRIKIKGVELGRIRVGFRDQGVGLGVCKVVGVSHLH